MSNYQRDLDKRLDEEIEEPAYHRTIVDGNTIFGDAMSDLNEVMTDYFGGDDEKPR